MILSARGADTRRMILSRCMNEMKIIARIYNDYTSKFGIPRQSGLVESENSLIVFEPEFRAEEALRGIEESNYIWLIWEFSEFKDTKWSPTVRPPRLGGNKRLGVFATRSPHRPNPIGLSAVKLTGKIKTPCSGTALTVSGADLMNGTPIYDIKPYIPYADIKPDAVNHLFDNPGEKFKVMIPDGINLPITKEKAETLKEILSLNPAPRYIDDPERIYGMSYGGLNIKFKISDKTVTVTEITEEQ